VTIFILFICGRKNSRKFVGIYQTKEGVNKATKRYENGLRYWEHFEMDEVTVGE